MTFNRGFRLTFFFKFLKSNLAIIREFMSTIFLDIEAFSQHVPRRCAILALRQVSCCIRYSPRDIKRNSLFSPQGYVGFHFYIFFPHPVSFLGNIHDLFILMTLQLSFQWSGVYFTIAWHNDWTRYYQGKKQALSPNLSRLCLPVDLGSNIASPNVCSSLINGVYIGVDICDWMTWL